MVRSLRYVMLEVWMKGVCRERVPSPDHAVHCYRTSPNGLTIGDGRPTVTFHQQNSSADKCPFSASNADQGAPCASLACLVVVDIKGALKRRTPMLSLTPTHLPVVNTCPRTMAPLKNISHHCLPRLLILSLHDLHITILILFPYSILSLITVIVFNCN